jgi:hypothetical protein
MRGFWKKLKSVKLAVVLIAVMVLGSLLATLVPQGEPSEKYFQIYPKLVAELLTQTGLTRYFSSILFLIPALLFFLNLGACTIDRLLRELRKRGRRRHGPDILHLGLLVLMVGSVISFSGRAEGSVRLAEGESVQLPGGELLRLQRFSDERYPDGRPKAWTSVVDLEKDGKPLKTGVEIKVNKPLHVGDLTIYQSSYASELGLLLTGPDGKSRLLARGETFEEGKLSVFYMTTEPPAQEGGEALALVRVKGAAQDGVMRVGTSGAQIGGYHAATALSLTTGLQAVKDPGYLVVLVSLVLIGAGTAFTFFQKLKDVEA